MSGSGSPYLWWAISVDFAEIGKMPVSAKSLKIRCGQKWLLPKGS